MSSGGANEHAYNGYPSSMLESSLDESYDEEGPLKFEREKADQAAASAAAAAMYSSYSSRKISPEPRSDSVLVLSGTAFGKDLNILNTDMLLDSTPSSAQSSPDRHRMSVSGKFLSVGSNKVVQIGSSWSVGVQCLKQSSSAFECIGHLRYLGEILDSVDFRDRIRYCKSDFIAAVNEMRRKSAAHFLISDELLREITSMIKKYFDQSWINKLPYEMLFEIFNKLGIDEFSVYSSTCQFWNFMASRDEVWRSHYHHRFTRSNPTSAPRFRKDYKTQYHARLKDPELGDKVEVAWRGKFRLEARDVYQGLAWWVAEVVDKHTEQGKYKIRYPGWESRWDEWVPRSRLRWAVESNTLCQISTGDVVELWCCGANVPGAWLESRVKKIRDGRYCVNRVLTTGAASHSRPLWAERDRLRLVRHPQDPENLQSVSSGSDEYDRTAGRRRRSVGEMFTSMVGSLLGVGAAASTSNVDDEQHPGEEEEQMEF
jgi:hypothetical protein